MQSLNILTSYSSESNGIELFTEMNPLQPSSHSLLLEQLQTTIDLQKLLEIYSMEAAKYVELSGLSFTNDEFFEKIRGSEPSNIQRHYNISVEGEHLGRLTYSSSKPISAKSEIALKQLHKTLSFPLRNALQYKHALKMASQDVLTNLGNRAAFDQQFTKATQQAKRQNWLMTLVLIDLNKFKLINDTHGHHIGDLVLVHFAQALSASIRTTDSCFRFGGDEFAIILEDSNSETKEVIAKRLTKAIEQDQLLSHYQLGFSLGTAVMRDGEKQNELFIRADKSLYRDKQHTHLTVI